MEIGSEADDVVGRVAISISLKYAGKILEWCGLLVAGYGV
jgi:hypothetical protein